MKEKVLASKIALFLILTIVYTGCMNGGETGGDLESNAQVLKSVQALPSVYDFGIVTLGNTPAPLEVKIQNSGASNLKVSDIVLSDTDNFALDLGGGPNPCSLTSPTIGVGHNCTVNVTFIPQFSALFNATLQIESNDSSLSTVDIQLKGSAEPITAVSVRINQVESDVQCPSAKVTAYVSIIDQGGYPVDELSENNLAVYENSTLMNLMDFSYVSLLTAPISIALVLDYSGSISSLPEAMSDMEEAAVDFVEQLGADDEAEIIKFSTNVEIVQVFTSDKNLLTDAIYNPAGVIGGYTSLYDAAWKAVDDTASRQKTRKAVIILTDGGDNDSNHNLSDVITHASDNGVPIFAIGLGGFDINILEQMANDTGGEFFESGASDNLRNIYAQLADVLFENQYVLEYISSAGVGETTDLTIEADVSQTAVGDDTKEISPCP